MLSFLSASHSARLQKAARQYKNQVKLGEPWNKWNDE